jgi:dynein heavy chain
MDKLASVMESYLSEYNMVSKTPMSIVMFQFAIDHVSRLSRVLKQDSGHALLIGMGGSGRQSCCKLAAFIAGYELCQVPVQPKRSV